jgi:predicted metal-dependent phosphoesterase TrpH
MRTKPRPLLCELHAHTRWSDGVLSIRELVDLHGRNGFDVLAITDHVVRRDDPWRTRPGIVVRAVDERTWVSYLAEIERESQRALATYGLVVVPGLELTFNDEEAVKAAHAVALGLRQFASVDAGIAGAIETAVQAGAAVVAAHPYGRDEPAGGNLRVTQRFSRDAGLRGLVHRFELFNRSHLFGWVADAGLPAVAAGDFHTTDHLAGWRTLIPCERSVEAVVEYLRSPRPVYLTRFDAEIARVAA